MTDATVQAWLDEAGKTVTVDWGADQDSAQIYLAAHLMSMAGIGPNAGSAAMAGIKSFSSGSISITKDSGDFRLTPYGLQYEALLRLNRGGLRVTGTGDLPWPWGEGVSSV